jgi:HD-like signal output (HDOD) protein
MDELPPSKILLILSIAALLGGLSFWWLHRGRRRGLQRRDEHSRPGNDAARPLGKVGGAQGPASVDVDGISAIGTQLTERLWRLAFAAPARLEALPPADIDVKIRVFALLGADRLDGKFYPRRPTLMPQLMRATEDPHAATLRLSRIVAHDPVLAADVLRLANSSRFRTSAQPIETIQRAIVVMGVDALRGLLAMAMLQPVFRASRNNFPRFPRMLWERTERAVRAAEAYAMQAMPADRFEAQLAILLSALGPLVVYGATLEVYAQSPDLPPNAAACAAIISALGVNTAAQIARDWRTSARLAAAIERAPDEPLSQALCIGELLGTLSLLQSQQLIESKEALDILNGAGLSAELLDNVSPRAA